MPSYAAKCFACLSDKREQARDDLYSYYPFHPRFIGHLIQSRLLTPGRVHLVGETWYKGENEMIKFSDRVHLNLNNNILSIKNLSLDDTNMYRCVNPGNEFSTNVVVVKNYKGNPKKIMRHSTKST